jgi:hypothetical protein
MPILSQDTIVNNQDVMIFTVQQPPQDGVTGAGQAGPGSQCIDRTSGRVYSNTGTKASPVWDRNDLISIAEVNDAAITTDKIADLNVTTGKLADASVTTGKLDPTVVQTATKTLTNAQMLALRATPITAIADPGDGFAILVDEVFISSATVTAGWTESTDNIAVEYAGGTDILVIETTGLIDQVGSQIRVQRPNFTVLIPEPSAAVQLFNNGDGEFGGGNAASTFTVKIRYRVVAV